MLIFCSIIIGQTSFANDFWPLIMPQNIDIARVPPHLHFFKFATAQRACFFSGNRFVSFCFMCALLMLPI